MDDTISWLLRQPAVSRVEIRHKRDHNGDWRYFAELAIATPGAELTFYGVADDPSNAIDIGLNLLRRGMAEKMHQCDAAHRAFSELVEWSLTKPE